MKFRPPRDGSGDRRGNDAAYRFCSRDNNAREGVGRREESWKKDRGKKEKKKKEERGNGREIKAKEEEEKRGVSRVRGARRGHWVRAGHAGRRERSISRWRRAMRARVVVVHADRVDAAWFVAARKS